MNRTQFYRYSDANTFTDHLTLEQANEFRRLQNGGKVTRCECAKCRKNRARRERDQAMRDLGLKRVRGALGGVYWE